MRELKSELKNNIEACKSSYSYDNNVVTKSILGLFTKLINKFERLKSYEAGLFIKSMDDWINRKDNDNKPLDNKITSIQKGEIFMVDWNIGYTPELSYEHPCVVIEVVDNFIFALPVSSQPQYLEIGYHPIDKPDGNRNYRIVDVPDGFAKKCILHLNQVKCISSTRILYKIGSISVDESGESQLYNEIKEHMLNTYFRNEYNKLIEENADYKQKNEFLSEQRKRNQSRADRLRNENEQLRLEICRLQSIIDKNNE